MNLLIITIAIQMLSHVQYMQFGSKCQWVKNNNDTTKGIRYHFNAIQFKNCSV